MKKFIISTFIGAIFFLMLSCYSFAAEITLYTPSPIEKEIAPGRDFYVIGTVNQEGDTEQSVFNIKIELINSNGDTVRELLSNVAPNGVTSAQYFLTDYSGGISVNDAKADNIKEFTPPDIIYDGYDKDSLRYPDSKIVVTKDYFAACIYGGTSKGFDLLYTDLYSNPYKDIEPGEYTLVITAISLDGEELCSYRQELRFGSSSGRFIASDNSNIIKYASDNGICVNNSIVGQWTPDNYFDTNTGFSYTIPQRLLANINAEYGGKTPLYILLNKLSYDDLATNYKLGTAYNSSAKKTYLYYDIGEKEVGFTFNSSHLTKSGKIIANDKSRFVQILRSETEFEDDNYVDFNSADGFVLTKGKATDFYGVFSPSVISAVLGSQAYDFTNEIAYVKFEICDNTGNLLFEDYTSPYMIRENSDVVSQYEFKFSVTPDDKIQSAEGITLTVSLCNLAKDEVLKGAKIPLKVNMSGKFIGGYDDNYWGKAFCDTINNLGQNPTGEAFMPDEFITRGDFASMINRIFGYGITSDAEFADITEESIYYSDCAVAYAAGYMTGDENSRICADDYISREQAIIMLARISQADCKENDFIFNDDAEISFWARDYVDIMSSNGVVTGFEGYLYPKESITVAEAAALVIKTFKWMYTTDNQSIVNSDTIDDFLGKEVSDSEFISSVTFDAVSEFYENNYDIFVSIANYIKKNCLSGAYVSKVGKGLEIRDYTLGNYITFSDDAVSLIIALSDKFPEFSIRYNPSSENAVNFALGREDGKLRGIVYTPLSELKNKELINIEGNWYFYFQK